MPSVSGRLQYDGARTALSAVSNPELTITKDVSCFYATTGGTLYYQITIENPTGYIATKITLTDELNEYFEDLEFTLDGENWLPWVGSLQIDDLNPGSSGDIIIRGKTKQSVFGLITNVASVEATFCSD
jgi:hypothetical protein